MFMQGARLFKHTFQIGIHAHHCHVPTLRGIVSRPPCTAWHQTYAGISVLRLRIDPNFAITELQGHGGQSDAEVRQISAFELLSPAEPGQNLISCC
jgi:hypothetical protein